MTREVLARLRTRALRQQVWFRALDHLERGLVDLTIRWVDQVKSGRLRRVLMEILAKLVRALDIGMVKDLERGKTWAARSSDLAVRWGNMQAYRWRFEEAFQRFLGLGLGTAND